MATDPALEQSFLFSRLDAPEKAALRSIITLEAHRQGEVLFHEATPSTHFYLLLEGLVRMVKVSPRGRELTLHVVHPGHLFAEAAVFGHSRYPATALIQEDARVAAIPRREFLDLLERHPPVALKLIATLSGWVRELARKLEERSFLDVGARVARFLQEEARRAGEATFQLSQNKGKIAEQLGTTPESFSRALHQLKQASLITVEGKRITILDGAALEAAVKGEQ